MEIALFSQCNIFSLRFHFHPFFVRFFSVSCFPSECGLLRRPIRSAGAAACVGVAMQARYRAIGAADVGPPPWGSLATYDTRVKQISKKKNANRWRDVGHIYIGQKGGGRGFLEDLLTSSLAYWLNAARIQVKSAFFGFFTDFPCYLSMASSF